MLLRSGEGQGVESGGHYLRRGWQGLDGSLHLGPTSPFHAELWPVLRLWTVPAHVSLPAQHSTLIHSSVGTECSFSAPNIQVPL